MTIRKIAIVGAGASGLAAIKVCLEHDFDPVCFEKSCDIGGWWNCQVLELTGHSTHPRARHSTLARNSKEFMAFSDFPPPKEFPNFLPQAKFLDYLRKYASVFNLEPHIQFNSEVTDIRKADTYEQNGKLIVDYREKKSLRNNSETFDAVFLCTGHWIKPYFPEISGVADFQDQLLHSSQFKTRKKFENQRILVVGLNNSAVDICVELCHLASQVFLSTNGKEGAWLMSRMAQEGIPWDCHFLTSWKHALLNWPLTSRFFQKCLEKECKKRYDHVKFSLKSEQGLWQVDPPIISDEFPLHLQTGKIMLKPSVSSFHSYPLPFVLFEDGSIETGIDTVILDTGFSLEFPALGKLVLCDEGKPALHNHIFPADLPFPTLAVIGLVYPVQGGDNSFVMAEMQCRLVCQVASNFSLNCNPTNSNLQDTYQWWHLCETLHLRSFKNMAQVQQPTVPIIRIPVPVVQP